MAEAIILIKAGKYVLKMQKQGNWDFFLSNEDGEGMSLCEKDLEEMLDEHFKEHF